jgi:hypothetical protein
MLSYGQGQESYDVFFDGKANKQVPLNFGKCSPLVLPDKSRIVKSHFAVPTRCYNFFDSLCNQIETPAFEDLPAGTIDVPADATGFTICYPKN